MQEDHQVCVLNERCGSQQVLEVISGKWAMLVIYALCRGTLRHSELQRVIGGVSQKMLTQTLRNLERDGIVSRKIHPVVPPKVEYALTPLGKSLKKPLMAICQWAEAHFAEIEAARSQQNGSAVTRA